MGFSIRVMPGVRVRASSRGVRASVGPRALRVHAGSGRTGISTGVGPVSYYTSVGGTSRRGRSGGSGRPQGTGSAAASRQLAAAGRRAEKAEQAKALADSLQQILDLHRAEFDAATPQTPTPPPQVDLTPIRARHRAAARTGTRPFSAQRKAAVAAADVSAQAEADVVAARWRDEFEQWHRDADHWWTALNGGEPQTVMAALATAFEDNEAAAAPLGVEGREATLVVLVPPPSAVPERRPTLTDSGNLSLKKLTKRQSSDLYLQMVCGYLLVTLKEAFAVVPGLHSVRVVAVRATPVDTYGRVQAEAVMAARVERSRLAGVRWADADAAHAVNDVATELVWQQKGPSHELVPIDLNAHPQIATVLNAVDIDELADATPRTH